MTDKLHYELADGIATLRMDDGKVNAMSLSMIAALNAALDRAEADKAAVLLLGREGTFSAGFDLKTLAAGGDSALQMLTSGFRLAQRLLQFPLPVVIGSSGHALAMGVFLVLCGDYRIGADGPFRYGANEVAIGLPVPHAAVEICRQRLAPAHFHRAVIQAEIYSPSDAVTAGFLDQVVPAAVLEQSARAKALQLLQLNQAAFTKTKLRARAETLAALRAANEADEREFRAMVAARS